MRPPQIRASPRLSAVKALEKARGSCSRSVACGVGAKGQETESQTWATTTVRWLFENYKKGEREGRKYINIKRKQIVKLMWGRAGCMMLAQGSM